MLIQPPILAAFLLASIVAGIAFLAGWLSKSGAIATVVVGFLIFWLGGGAAALPLIAFFVSSSLLTVLFKRSAASDPGRIPGNRASKSARTARQVLANGGVATVLVVVYHTLAYRMPTDTTRIVQIMFLAAIATVNADTWSTEIGGRFGGSPRQLSNWRKVRSGTSGAISLVGTLASVVGAAAIPLCTYKLWGMTNAEAVCVTWAAILGSMADSILGAGIQGQFRDPDTHEISDDKVVDGQEGTLLRGVAWIDNNVVNLMASVCGALFCWILIHYGMRNSW